MQGKSNKQIALVLGISENTIEYHLKNLYAKLHVHSRTEAILKLGKSVGVVEDEFRESVVDSGDGNPDNNGRFILWKRWVSLIRDTASAIKEEIEMKNRLLTYALGGLVFGLGFWFYFNDWMTGLLRGWSVDEGNPLMVWAYISIFLVTIFGIWLVPAGITSVYEFRRSRKVALSACAVMVTWVSAVFGYYLTYIFLLAFVGFPQMDYYLVFGQRGPAFWSEWGHFLASFILFDALKWIALGVAGGGLAGFVTSSLYSYWVRKTNEVLPA
jgi:hypothetical protein